MNRWSFLVVTCLLAAGLAPQGFWWVPLTCGGVIALCVGLVGGARGLRHD